MAAVGAAASCYDDVGVSLRPKLASRMHYGGRFLGPPVLAKSNVFPVFNRDSVPFDPGSVSQTQAVANWPEAAAGRLGQSPRKSVSAMAKSTVSHRKPNLSTGTQMQYYDLKKN